MIIKTYRIKKQESGYVLIAPLSAKVENIKGRDKVEVYECPLWNEIYFPAFYMGRGLINQLGGR